MIENQLEGKPLDFDEIMDEWKIRLRENPEPFQPRTLMNDKTGESFTHGFYGGVEGEGLGTKHGDGKNIMFSDFNWESDWSNPEWKKFQDIHTGEPMEIAFQLLKMPQEARAFAEQAHEGQFYDEEKQIPYMEHVNAVASQFDDPHMQRIAYLHDTVEDNPNVTIDDIYERFGEDVGNAVNALTRGEDPSNQGGREVYMDYIRRLAEHPEARQVKIADLTHNLSGNPGSLRQRYEKALEMLS
jgi:hypothetical protein